MNVIFATPSSLVALLKKLAPTLGKLPNAIQVGGHTDARPFAPGRIWWRPTGNWRKSRRS